MQPILLSFCTGDIPLIFDLKLTKYEDKTLSYILIKHNSGSFCEYRRANDAKHKEIKDRKQFNSKIEPNYNVSQTKEGQCALVPEDPRLASENTTEM